MLSLILTPINSKFIIFMLIFGYFFIEAHGLVWNLFHYIYPAFETINIISIETEFKCNLLHSILIYFHFNHIFLDLYEIWFIFVAYNLLEDGLGFFISYIPLYNLIKVNFSLL
jgi:hypothetical protein